MPALPYRRHRHRRRSWSESQLEQWRAPRVDRTAVRGMLLGAAIGTAMWIAVITISTVAYRWWVG